MNKKNSYMISIIPMSFLKLILYLKVHSDIIYELHFFCTSAMQQKITLQINLVVSSVYLSVRLSIYFCNLWGHFCISICEQKITTNIQTTNFIVCLQKRTHVSQTHVTIKANVYLHLMGLSVVVQLVIKETHAQVWMLPLINHLEF